MGLRRAGQTHSVDMIRICARGRAVPDPRRKRSSRSPASREFHLFASDLAGVEVAGWAELPNHVVAVTAVPGLTARPLSTRPSLPGGYATGCGPVRARRVTTGQSPWDQLEDRAREGPHDQRNWDITCKYAAYVPGSADLEHMRGSGSGNMAADWIGDGSSDSCSSPATSMPSCTSRWPPSMPSARDDQPVP